MVVKSRYYAEFFAHYWMCGFPTKTHWLCFLYVYSDTPHLLRSIYKLSADVAVHRWRCRCKINMQQKFALFISSTDVAVGSWHAVGTTFEMTNIYLSPLRRRCRWVFNQSNWGGVHSMQCCQLEGKSPTGDIFLIDSTNSTKIKFWYR